MSDDDGYAADVWRHRDKYHQPPSRKKHYPDDRREQVRKMYQFLAEEADRRKKNFSTLNLYEFAKEIGGRFWKEFFDAMAGKRVNR